MAAGTLDLRDLVARAAAVTTVRGSDDFIAVCAAFKRMKNLITQADESGITSKAVEFPAVVNMHPAQIVLNNAVFKVSERYAVLCSNHEYVEALKLLATLRPEVDAFMDPKTGVKVMDDVPYIRETRLNLLRQILTNFSRIADFSEIVTAR
jgi:glycyl-tRNA synthetase beta chain